MCTCAVHPCIDSNGDHTDGPCNPGGGALHVCVEVPGVDSFNNPVCNYQCTCGEGYDHGSENRLDYCYGMILLICCLLYYENEMTPNDTYIVICNVTLFQPPLIRHITCTLMSFT